MASLNAFNGLAKDFEEFKGKYLKKAEKLVIQAVTRAHQVAVFETRFKTGRAKGGWIITLGEKLPDPVPHDEQVLDVASGRKALNAGKEVTKQFTLKIGELTISNNVDYINVLEDGGPFIQPPGLMSRKAALAAAAFLREGIKVRFK